MPKQTKEIERLAVELRASNPEIADAIQDMLSTTTGLLMAVMAAIPESSTSGEPHPAGKLMRAVVAETLMPIDRALHALSEGGDRG